MDAGLQMIFFCKIATLRSLITSDIVEKCLLSIFMQVVLTVGETQLGKKLMIWLGKGCLPATICVS